MLLKSFNCTACSEDRSVTLKIQNKENDKDVDDDNGTANIVIMRDMQSEK